MNQNETVASKLKKDEGEILDIKKWYLHIKDFSEPEINLFFKRLRECVFKRISPTTTELELKEIQNTTKGISTVELWFLAIKKETLDNEA